MYLPFIPKNKAYYLQYHSDYKWGKKWIILVQKFNYNSNHLLLEYSSKSYPLYANQNFL